MTKIACILGLMGMLASLSPLTDIQNVEKKNVPIAGVISAIFEEKSSIQKANIAKNEKVLVTTAQINEDIEAGIPETYTNEVLPTATEMYADFTDNTETAEEIVFDETLEEFSEKESSEWQEPGSKSITQEVPPIIIEADIEFSTAYLNRWGIELADAEMDLLAKIVWVEARGESEIGQEAVVEVIFNRMKSSEYPNDLLSVVSQNGQFESWDILDTATPTEKEYTSIETVLNGETAILSEDTYYFATTALTDDIEKPIGGHIFCR